MYWTLSYSTFKTRYAKQLQRESSPVRQRFPVARSFPQIWPAITESYTPIAAPDAMTVDAMATARAHAMANLSNEVPLLRWLTSVFSMIPLGALLYYLGMQSFSQADEYRRLKPTEKSQKMLYGVNVSMSDYFNRPAVAEAVTFAAKAHDGQKRKTGEDYITHCIHTALILEELLDTKLSDERCERAMICAVLHDVLDDTSTTGEKVENSFGPKIAHDLKQISHLSSLIQILRRQRRIKLKAGSQDLSKLDDNEQRREDSKLRTLILKSLDDPLVLAIKLADRLHNLRTSYALDPEKQKSIAIETQKIFCTLAARLDLLSLKAEMEDLCYCVLKPEEFFQIYQERAILWKRGKPQPERCSRRKKIKIHQPTYHEEAKALVAKQGIPSCKDLLQLVTPFTQVRWSQCANPPKKQSFALSFLKDCAKRIHFEIQMNSFSAGLDIEIICRIKSLYSTANKMNKKETPIDDIFDILGLKIVVSEEGGLELAQEVCYKILSLMENLWKKIPTELDDYILSPKESGYQSLHAAFMSDEGIPFEIQIRTASMDRDAEYGHAAHWQYKEIKHSDMNENSAPESIRDQIWGKATEIKGRPVIRINDGARYDGFVLNIEEGGRVLIVAVSTCKRISRVYRSYTYALNDSYEELKEYCRKRGWTADGCGDFFVSIQRYVLCTDHAYHRLDQFGHKHSTIVRPIKAFDSQSSLEKHLQNLEAKSKRSNSTLTDDELAMNERVSHLRSMMCYYEDIVPFSPSQNIYVLIWPEAKIKSFPRGSTAADVLSSIEGAKSKTQNALIKVNDQFVLPNTTLQDADVIALT